MRNELLYRIIAAGLVLPAFSAFSHAQEQPVADASQSGGASSTEAPHIFLDKNPRIVAYQLKRLTNPQLISLERKDTEAKYKPVYEALLTRHGLDRKYRQEAVTALAKLNHSDPVVEILEGIGRVDPDDKATAHELVGLLLTQKPAALAAQREKIESLATGSDNPTVKQAAYAALVTADGAPDKAWALAEQNNGVAALLSGVSLINDAKLRDAFYDRAKPLAEKAPDAATQVAAIDALGNMPEHAEEAFKALASIVEHQAGDARDAAIRSIRRIPDDKWPDDQVQPLAKAIVALLAQTPADRRTSPAMLQAIQLGDDLTGALPDDQAAPVRKALRDLGVRVIAIRTLREQMAFDQRYFVVPAGKPVEVIVENDDSMPHNFVITAPGALQEVAVAAGTMTPPNDPHEPAYIPKTPKVLHAMVMVQPDESQTLSFNAPMQPGEYPFVCTFPGHWVRMYGIMLVVPDLDAWEKNPTPPSDPLTHTPMKSQKNDPNTIQGGHVH
jgi:azurin